MIVLLLKLSYSSIVRYAKAQVENRLAAVEEEIAKVLTSPTWELPKPGYRNSVGAMSNTLHHEAINVSMRLWRYVDRGIRKLMNIHVQLVSCTSRLSA